MYLPLFFLSISASKYCYFLYTFKIVAIILIVIIGFCRTQTIYFVFLSWNKYIKELCQHSGGDKGKYCTFWDTLIECFEIMLEESHQICSGCVLDTKLENENIILKICAYFFKTRYQSSHSYFFFSCYLTYVKYVNV